MTSYFSQNKRVSYYVKNDFTRIETCMEILRILQRVISLLIDIIAS